MKRLLLLRVSVFSLAQDPNEQSDGEDNKEIRRRSRVVGAFPDGQSALMLYAARLRHISGTKWGSRRYLDMDLLREMTARRQLR